MGSKQLIMSTLNDNNNDNAGKQNLTEYGENELSLCFMNDESLYQSFKRAINFSQVKAIADECYTYDSDQLADLETTWDEEQNEEANQLIRDEANTVDGANNELIDAIENGEQDDSDQELLEKCYELQTAITEWQQAKQYV